MTTYDKKRLVGAFVMAFVALALANSFFDFVFPRFANGIVPVSVLVALVYIIRCAPTQEDFEEHRRIKGGG